MPRRNLPQPVRLTDDGGSDKYPRIIADRRGRLWLAWQRFTGARDDVVVTCLRDNTVVFQQAFSVAGFAYKPVLCEDAAGRIVVAWSEISERGAQVFLTSIERGQHAPPVQVSLGGKDLEPSLAADDRGGLWVAYHSFRSGRGRVFLRRFSGGWSDEIEAAPGMEAYRPALVTLGGGRARVYFDAFSNGRYDVYCAELDEETSGEPGARAAPVRLSSGGTWCSTPAAATDGRGGAVAAWCGIGADAYVSYDVAADGRTERVASAESWYASHDVCADSEAVWLAWRKPRSQIMARRLDRASRTWSAPMLLCEPGLYNRRPTIALDRSAVWFAWQGSPGGGKHAVRRADIYLQRLYPEDAAASADAAIPPHAWPSEAGHEIVASPEPPQFSTASGERLFFGDLHGQIGLSDGLGTHDQFYNFAESVSRLDFGVVTDHCEFPDELSASEWNLTRLLASAFNVPGRFVTFLAYEWASNEVRTDYGHKNVYFPAEAGEIFSPCRPGGATPEALFAGARRYGALVVPHHVSANWGSVSAATDWSHHDPETQRLCEITSAHGVMEYDGNPRAHGNPPVPNSSVQSALARGYRLGLIGGSDTHRLAPGRNGGIAAVVADTLSREALFAALWARRCYASTGPRLLIEFAVNGHAMGSEVPWHEVAGPVTVSYGVEADRALVAVEIVRNNATVHRQTPRGPTTSNEWRDPATPSPGTYYYLRVELEGREFAWSSPVWLG
jgi:hypothetical protein